MRQSAVAVVGAGDPDLPSSDPLTDLAERVGAEVARAGGLVYCGGLGGVMAAACRGAKAAGGTTIGILPGGDRSAANPWVDVAIATGLGEARNLVLVRSADAVVAVGGGYGTLSEIAFARKLGRPVVGLHTWAARAAGDVTEPLVTEEEDPAAAVALALRLAHGQR
ncbi:MAG: TIGR00725 family protein [Nitriliruptorales bacterium]|nr:TIGR00725 family protein [Nitriliruptorales bacterium]